MSVVVEVLERRGGVATRADLVEATSRTEVDRALMAGTLTVLARRRYALAAADEARQAAHRISGVVCRRSAALLWGWEVKTAPERPEIAVPRKRKLTDMQKQGVSIHWVDLHDSEIDHGVTSKERTLTDCIRTLPFDEALAIADSALRHGFSSARLKALAAGARGPGSSQARRVTVHARGEAANPFESCLRAIALEVEGMNVRPQVSIHEPTFLGRPDLVDERLRIVLEADSFEWHGGRAELKKDTRRYNAFTVQGWLVLRFAWEDVMFDPAWVTSILVAAVAERADQRCFACRAA